MQLRELGQFFSFSESGDMFVTSESADQIFIYDKSGSKKSTIGSHGTGGELQFNVPNGIAICNEVVYITEHGGNRMQKITADGKYLDSFGEPGSNIGQFNML